MLTNTNAKAFILRFRRVFKLQQTSPTEERESDLQKMFAEWIKYNGGDKDELIEIAIGS